MGDWDGDGAETPGIFAQGHWQLWNKWSVPGDADVTASFGRAGDVPVTGDWNGDGVTDVGVVRGSSVVPHSRPAGPRCVRAGVAPVHVR